MMMPLQYPVIHAQRVDPCGYAWILPAILQNKAELLTHQDEHRSPNYVETPLLATKMAMAMAMATVDAVRSRWSRFLLSSQHHGCALLSSPFGKLPPVLHPPPRLLTELL